MDDTPTTGPKRGNSAAQVPANLTRKLALTRAALAWELLWPTLITPLCIAGIYAALALINIWESLPGLVHWLAALATVGSIGWFTYQAARQFQWPTPQEALRRLETGSGLTHRPLSALADARATFAGNKDAGTALWARHLAGLQAAAAKARTVPPHSNAARIDVFALRALVFLLLVSALVYAGRDAPARLAANLLPNSIVSAGPSIAFDAWITPPTYTGIPPLFLNTVQTAGTSTTTPVTVPTGSVLTARVYGTSSADIRLAGDTHKFDAAISDAREINLPLTASGMLDIRANGRVLDRFNIELIPDLKPQILFTEGDALSVTAQLTLAVGYDVLDDYGATAAEMRITLPDPADAPEDLAADGSGDSADTPELGALAAIEPPVLKLPLPSPRVTDAQGEFAYKDMTDHPWAGLQVAVTLAAFDEAGQEGLSQTRIMRLPQRRFTDPVARAVIEQRQRLARMPEDTSQVATALNALTLHADRYYDHANDYLPLRAAYWRLREAEHPGDVEGIYELLWDIALHFEDGELSLAETSLRDAQDALMEALANGAPDAEIDRLMKELRVAMDQFLQALAQQQMQQGADGQMSPMDPNMQMLELGDLESLLDALQDLARSGSRDAARQLLSELRQMMENLATGTPAPPTMTPQQSTMNDAITKLGEIIDRQRLLQDETVQEGNAVALEDLPGPPEEDTPGMKQDEDGDDLLLRQEQLRSELEVIREALNDTGVESPSAIGRADRAMRDAEQALKEGGFERSASKQGEAIENLRNGAQALAESLLEDFAVSEDGQRQQGTGSSDGRDPFDREPNGGDENANGGFQMPDKTDIQRARRILEELQRRAGDQERPPIELDYLNRLLQRF